MNLCFIIGKIISEIKFEFLLNSKNTSIVIFQIELDNKSIIEVKTYNEIADKCYQKLTKADRIAIQGKINSNMEIIMQDFDYLF